MAERLAHVSYVLTEEGLAMYGGSDYEFLVEPLADPVNWVIFIVSLAVIGLGIYAGNNIPFLRDRVRYFRGRARSYQEFIPWILRFSIGTALIGAGGQQALVSPAVQHQPGFAVIQIVLGFLIITGFAMTPAIVGALALTVGALIFHPTLADNLEIIGAIIAVLLLGQAKPGLDDLLGLPMYKFSENVQRWVPFVLRLGLGGALLVMAIGDKLLNPHWFGAVVENYDLAAVIPVSTAMWVTSGTLVELALGIAIVLGLQTRIVSLVTFVVLSGFFFFFGEQVSAHVTLFACLFVLMITGGGFWSLDDYYAKRRQQRA